MSYKSPIELIAGQIETETENEIVRAIQRMGINIDKNELLRALAYDRNQYAKGYHDRDSEIVRCKDCKHSEQCIPSCEDRYCVKYDQRHDGNWYCADGERREAE